MPRLTAASTPAFRELVGTQAGVVSRGQALKHGMTGSQIKAMVSARRWDRHLPGVYVTFTGPLPPQTLVWGALLYAGEGATVSLGTAAWLSGLRNNLPPRIDVCVPLGRRVTDQPGLHVAVRRNLASLRHPAQLPPRTRVEETVLDLVDRAVDADEVAALLTGACHRRLTTAALLARAARSRSRLRWRELVGDVLDDVMDSVHSALERRYCRLERAHGLPAGARNHAEGSPGRYRYRDVHYEEFMTVVELDGNAAHPIEDRELDRARDNAVTESAQVTLRYGWKSVAGAPCATAAQVGRVLRNRGWRGRLRRCGPQCPAAS